jgi:dynamin 1-like protein
MSEPSSNPLSLGLHFQLLQRAGSLIIALDGLRKELAGLAELSFPQIIVLGEESAGKSSVLERIAMLKFFPRSDNMCTRMPIKLQLKHLNNEDMQAFCLEHGQSFHAGVAFVRARMEDSEVKPGEWSSFLPVDQVEKLVQRTMEQALKRRNREAIGTTTFGRSENCTGKTPNQLICAWPGVIEDVIAVEVTSSLVPNLTLIDLPGMCIYPRKGEPEDIMQRTQSLVEKYLRQEHTLVLLVLPALTRMHNYLPFTLLKKHKREKYTIGVLTKSDLAERPRYADKFHEYKLQLDGRSEDFVALQHGYVAVRSRDTARGVSLEEAAVLERSWFDEHLPGYVQAGKASSPVLVSKLVEMLCSYVENTWAGTAKTKIHDRLAQIKLDLADLGPLRQAKDLPLILADLHLWFDSG